jgi:hypothetical protein
MQWYRICADFDYWQLPGYRFIGHAFCQLKDGECPAIIIDTYELHLVKSIYADRFDPQAIEALKEAFLAFLQEESRHIPLSLELEARMQVICLLHKEISDMTLRMTYKIAAEKEERTNRYIPRETYRPSEDIDN